jgi:iron uptake system EfeUOB component EfeO/EfeM
MKCDICNKEKQWLEVIGADFVCHTCIQRENKLLGAILRTHMDSFNRVIKKKKVSNFEEFKKLTKEDIKDIIDVSHALNLKY